MTPSLADFWPALCPALPSAWDTPGNRTNLAAIARQMAPIPRIGLECRLDDDTPHLDLQQCIKRDDDEPAVARDFVAATRFADLEEDGGWGRLQRFLDAWADPATDVHRGVTETFLEYDLETTPQPGLTPSIFLALAEPDGAADQALALLVPSGGRAGLAANVDRCFAACPDGARIAYLGAMLGRTTDAVRLNVKGLLLDDLAPFLDAVGWSGAPRPVERWASWAYDRADHITVCLDVGPTVSPRVGLEFTLAWQPGEDPRWQAMLGEVAAEGLCAPERAADFLGAPGVVWPPETRTPWPAPWIAASLAAPTDRFSTAERRLSHVKCTVLGERAVFKGYWGAGHVWRTSDGRADVREHTPVAPPPTGGARARGVAFLLADQDSTGRWLDFLLPAGPSDEWVTAFVATCLLEADEARTRPAALRAWRALVNRRRGQPGWGYNRLTPPDADSTAWAVRLAGRLGLGGDEHVAVARAFLEEHVVRDGGVTTYAARDPILAFTRLPEDASFAGWRAPHTCVTAASAPVLGPAAAAYLAAQQAPAGHWTGYWWCDDEYTTALAAEAVPAARPRALAWACSRVGADGAVRVDDEIPSPWATAWCVRILRLGSGGPERAAHERAARWLTAAQDADGGWRGSARLRVPLPAQVDADAPSRRLDGLDHRRVFTTAAVVAALPGD